MKKFKKLVMLVAMVLVTTAVAGGVATMPTIQVHAAGLFDPVFYANLYPDVTAAIGTDADALYNHYVNYGQKEGRIPYEGAMPGEAVDGIAGAEQASTPAATTATIDFGDGPYWLYPNGEQVDKATFMQYYQQIKQNFDAAGYAQVGWTEEQVQAKLMSLKSVYPEGTVVGTCEVGGNKIKMALFGNGCVGQVYRGEGINDEWIYVDGYVKTVGMSSSISAGTLRSTLRVGDMLFTKGPNGEGHVSIVLSHDDNGITVVESNRNNDKAIHWGRSISWDELENGKASNSKYVRQNQIFDLWHSAY